MDLEPYIDTVRSQLASAAQAGGEDVRAVAEALTTALDSAVRLAILDALGAAVGEITRELAPGSVDLRLRGREPSFVVTPPPGGESVGDGAGDLPPVAPSDSDEGPLARINLRLPEDLKSRVEEAAKSAGQSVNAWLVRAAAAALATAVRETASRRRSAYGSDQYTGWIR